jgi:large subunit ribosomal protein L25
VSSFELEAQQRPQRGKGDNRRLRRLGRVPAIVDGAGREPQPVSMDHGLLQRQMDREAFYTSILTLKVEGDAQAVIVKEVQRHPFRPYVLHLDFQRIVEDEEITLHVPIHFLNEETAKGVKEQGGVIEHLMTEVEVTCLPRHLPEYLELDVAQLELNQILHLSDIALPEGVQIIALTHEQDHPVVAINPPRRTEEEEAEEAEVPEGEVPTVGEEEEQASPGNE